MKKEYKYWKPDFLLSDNKYNPDVGINLISSILVAYLSSCKSLFDAGAIALNVIYQLKLPPMQRDLNNKEFMKKLGQRLSPNRYDKFKEILADVTIKRNLAIHRATLSIIPLGNELLPNAKKKYPPLILDKHTFYPIFVEYIDPNDEKSEEREISYFKIFEYIDGLRSGRQTQNLDKKFKFTDPRELHDLWRPEFVNFCEKICEDIKKADFPSGHII